VEQTSTPSSQPPILASNDSLSTLDANPAGPASLPRRQSLTQSGTPRRQSSTQSATVAEAETRASGSFSLKVKKLDSQQLSSSLDSQNLSNCANLGDLPRKAVSAPECDSAIDSLQDSEEETLPPEADWSIDMGVKEGAQLVYYGYSKSTDMSCYIALLPPNDIHSPIPHAPRIVVAFKGTASFQNIMTDLR
jgi:hypothetical protein